MDEELHIAGIVVHAHAQDVQRVADAIAQLPAAALHAASPDVSAQRAAHSDDGGGFR
jgi:nitrate reductase NapAB chaperone NapD